MAHHLYIENYDTAVRLAGGIYTKKNLVVTGTTVTLPASTTIGGSSVSALGTITSSGAQAFAVGLNGATNPAFNIDCSTGSQAAGLNIKGATAAGSVAVSVISSGGAANLIVDALGTGTIGIGTVSSGAITLGRATTITAGDLTVTNGNIVVSANAKGLTFTGTGTNGGLLTNLYNAAASALSGTNVDIKIMIGATPYYFTVYPTKA